jgi:hypothetical protein
MLIAGRYASSKRRNPIRSHMQTPQSVVEGEPRACRSKEIQREFSARACACDGSNRRSESNLEMNMNR